MKFLEKNLEQIIFESNKKDLETRGIYIEGKLLRQVKIGNYGIADLVEYSRPYYDEGIERFYKGRIAVYELKQDKVNTSTFLQALGYLKGIRKFLETRGINDNYDYEIVLIGYELDLNDNFCYLTDFIGYQNTSEINDEPKFGFRVYTYDYKIDGIQFKNKSGYSLKCNEF